MAQRTLRLTVALTICGLLCAFGCGGGTAAPLPPGVPAFDADRAFADLTAQVAFGPRVPGSGAHTACAAWLEATLRGLATRVEVQRFTFHPRDGGAGIRGANVLAAFDARPGATLGPLLLSAHWDCRPVADQDPDPANRAKPVPGANDAASGVAVLLELARGLKEFAPPRPIYLALWDLEDSGNLPQTAGTPYQGFCQGSRFFAQNLDTWRPAEAINIDMIGDANLVITREGYSDLANPGLNDRLFTAAARLGHAQFANRAGQLVTDDHKPLIDVGIPAVNLIDFDYPGPRDNRHWHTLADTPDKCSPQSLKAVGETLLSVIFQGL